MITLTWWEGGLVALCTYHLCVSVALSWSAWRERRLDGLRLPARIAAWGWYGWGIAMAAALIMDLAGP